MTSIRVAIKFILFLIYIVIYLSVAALIFLFQRNEVKRTAMLLRLVQFFAKVGLKLIGFRVTYKNIPSDDQHYLIVGNHLGMLDILVLAAVRPSMFITSVEMRQTPLLGQLALAGGCLFVERRSRKQIPQEVLKIRQALQDGFNVVLYPEGTSSNGEGVLPLKKTLMTAAAGTGVPILPVVINFRKVNGEPVTYKNRKQICWWGPITFLEGLTEVFKQRLLEVDFEFCEPVKITTEEDRRSVAAQVQDRIVAAYTPIPLGPGEVSPYPPGAILRSLAESQAWSARSQSRKLQTEN